MTQPGSTDTLAPIDCAAQAARLLADAWRAGHTLEALPEALRPRSLDEGRAIQARWAGLLGDPIAGWKIAATSVAGQRHIAVDGPLGGPVFARHVHADGALVSLAHNRMRVAECEIVFGLGRTLAPRAEPYGRAEVLAAVSTLRPGIEVPDSRFAAFERAGLAQLVADCACMNEMVLGAPLAVDALADARLGALPELLVQARVSDGRSPSGLGRNVLGDPVEALVWLVNELTGSGRSVQAGQWVTTGASVPPIPVLPGDQVEADFGWIGRIAVRFA